MTMASNGAPVGMIARIAEWWRNLGGGWARLFELRNCGTDLDHIARDVGLSTSDFYAIAAKRPDAADELKLRLEALHMDRAALVHTDPRDLQRVCVLCGEKRQCKRDLARHPDDPIWRTYCPNVHTLQALEDGAAAGYQQ